MKRVIGWVKKVKGILDTVGKVVSTIVNVILLTFVYFVGVGLTALWARAKKHHFFERELDKNALSYWTPLPLGDRPREKFYRQF